MNARLICRVCGQEYEGCRTAKRSHDQFRWQDVACCPEHGQIYLERIIASRTPRKESVPAARKTTRKAPEEKVFTFEVPERIDAEDIAVSGNETESSDTNEE